MKLTIVAATSALLLASTGGITALAADSDSGGVYESDGLVEFIPNEDPTDPVDPTDPTTPVDPIDPTNPDGPNPGTSGPLSIDYASSFSFGKNKITNKDETYFSDAQQLKDGTFRPNYVQVSDNRGTNGGWTLTVKQEGQFSNQTTQNKVLTGSVLKLVEGKAISIVTGVTAPITSAITLDPTGAESPVMNAADKTGAGTWLDRFGTTEEMTINGETIQKNKAITLEVPGATPKDAVKYNTKLTWTLADIPDNGSKRPE